MKKLLSALACCLVLSGCAEWKEFTLSGGTAAPIEERGKPRLETKKYKVLGNVRGEYHRYCFLFGLACFGEVYIYDDLMQKTREMGGNSVRDLIVDTESSSPFWYILYSARTYRANGMAIRVTQTDEKPKDGYTD